MCLRSSLPAKIIATFESCHKHSGTVTIHDDNQETITYTKNPTYHEKINHINIMCNYMNEIVSKVNSSYKI